jgi:glutamate racemase
LLEAEGEPDICVLGCTHYPLIERHFAAALPTRTKLLSQPLVTAKSLTEYLRRHPQFRSEGAPQRQFLTTGNAPHVSALATRFYGRPVEFTSLTKAPISPS